VQRRYFKMRDYRIIFETDNKEYRILEYPDDSFGMQDLKGDSYCRKTNPDIDIVELARQEKEFEDLVNREGVFGYVLEKWNPKPGQGYEHIDSCWGFVGQYSESDSRFNHYIVEELKSQIKVGNDGK